MFNVGGPEIVVIFLVALIVLGPEQLPKAMRTLGNVMAEIRKVSSGFQAEMRNAMDTMTVDTTVPTTARRSCLGSLSSSLGSCSSTAWAGFRGRSRRPETRCRAGAWWFQSRRLA